MSEVQFITVPRLPELSTANIIEKSNLRNDEYFLNFCPEISTKPEPYDREFFFNVYNTIFDGALERIIY